MEFGFLAVFAIVLFGAIGIQFDAMKSAKKAAANLESELAKAGFKLISAKRTYFDVGPFQSSGAFRQPVFKLTAATADGALHSGWARWSKASNQFDLDWRDCA